MSRWRKLALVVGIVCLTVTVDGQSRLRIRGVAVGGGGGGNVLAANNFEWLGSFRVGGGGASPGNQHIGAFDSKNQRMTGRRVGGQNRIFLSQKFFAGDVAEASIVEIADPGTYNTDYTAAPIASLVTDWGRTAPWPAGAGLYDTWRGGIGKSYDSSGNPQTYPNFSLAGIAWRDDGSGTCCLYGTYGLNYGNYPVPALADQGNMFMWNLMIVDLVSQGNVLGYGPFRMCNGEYPYNSGTEVCGLMRSTHIFPGPSGEFCHGGANDNTQQGFSNRGPSIVCSSTWPTDATSSAFGSPRNGGNYRTTDIVATDLKLMHFSDDFSIDVNGVSIGGVKSCRRPPPSILTPPSGTRSSGCNNENLPYCYESAYFCASTGLNVIQEQVDPTQYVGNIGSWTAVDNMAGGAWIDAGTHEGWVIAALLCTADTWYQTSQCSNYQRTASEIGNGGGPIACPLHVVEMHSVTGPSCGRTEAALMIYDNADLNQTPSYAPDPDSIIYLRRQYGNSMKFASHLNALGNPHDAEGAIAGLWYEPVSQKLYIGAPVADTTTGLGENRTIIHVFQVNDSAPPAPAPQLAAVWSGAGLLALGLLPTLRRRPRKDCHGELSV